MFNRLFVSVVFLFFSFFSLAQNPVKWTFEAKCLGGDTYALIATATIQDGNYTYSQYLASDDGPVKTSFTYEDNKNITPIGKNEESGDKIELNDPLFDNMRIIKFKHKFVCTQKVKVNDITKPIKGYVTYMSCNEEQCMPPKDVDFKYVLPPCGSTTTGTTNAPNLQQPPTLQPVIVQQPVIEQPKANAIGKTSNPVKWTYEANKISDSEYDLVFKAAIDKGWAIYSQEKSGDDGPVPTSFSFKENKGIERIGKVTESKNRIEITDKIFKMKIKKFKNEAIFTQRIKITDASQPIEGYLTYMACDDMQCLPPTDVDFKFNFGTTAATPSRDTTGLSPNGCPPDEPNCQGVFDSKREGLNKDSYF
jgi:hypothetical protein